VGHVAWEEAKPVARPSIGCRIIIKWMLGFEMDFTASGQGEMVGLIGRTMTL
jgi:hypothetical protein